MSSDIALRVTELSKQYRLGLADTHLREALMRRVHHPLQARHVQRFTALREVSFEVPRGQVLGIVGANGAGKSTLLKIISRITHPDTGAVDIWGRVGSLIEVGTGFHPELTGRENVFLNGSILGMRRREIALKYDAIVDFSGIGAFMNTPVKRYSSGMLVRLAFAVAAHLDSEIVILDEVLAVGDADFQGKCLKKIESLTLDEGRTALFVSHNMVAVRRLCHRVIVLHQGAVAFDGLADEGLSLYLGQPPDDDGPLTEGTLVLGDEHDVATRTIESRAPARVTLRANRADLERGPLVITVVREPGVAVAQYADTNLIVAQADEPLGRLRTVTLAIPALDLPLGSLRVHAAVRLASGRLVELGATEIEVTGGDSCRQSSPAPDAALPDRLRPPVHDG